MKSFDTVHEHVLLQQVEEIGIPAYSLVKETDPFYVPSVLEFFNIVVNYMKMKEKLSKES